MADPADPTPHPDAPTVADLPDPGGAHGKGFSTDTPAAGVVPVAGPIPLTDGPVGPIRHPEYDGEFGLTGRDKPDPDAIVTS